MRLSHLDVGAGDPPMLLVHGWCLDRESMRPLADRLAPRHRVVCPDLREQGGSVATGGDYGPDDVVDDLAELVDAARLDRPVVVGHSLGGRYAMGSAARGFPRAVVLLDSSVVETPARQARRLADFDAPPGAGHLRTRMETLLFHADEPVVRRDELVARMLATPRAVARRSLVAGDGLDVAGALRTCAVPVLYVAGATYGETEPVLRALRPDIRYARLPGHGHFLPIFAADRVAALIEAFVADLPDR